MIRMPVSKRLLLAGYILLGPVLGVLLNFAHDTFSNIFLGFLISLISSFLVFPELRKTIPTIFNGKNSFGINMGQYFTHPTQLPMMFGGLWFVIVIPLLSLLISKFPSLIPVENRLDATTIVLLPSMILFGFSGYQMARRREMVGKFGQIHRGNWALFVGIIGILFSWGIALYLTLALVFNWQ